jgi:hypothetical protein
MTSKYISQEVRQQLAQEVGHRCGYCLADELLSGIPLTIEHIIPTVKGGSNNLDNLWLACRPCNEYKGVQTQAIDPITNERVSLYNPRTQRWSEHFAWSDDTTEMIGLTAIGRATIIALQINRPLLIKARRRWNVVGWHPPLEPGPAVG